jgi:hypothetical protein
MKHGQAAGLTGVMIAAAFAFAASAGAQTVKPTLDYLTAPFALERVLEWGERPVWSQDGTRIAFTRSDKADTPAYEMDLRTRKVRCLTCRWGANGRVSRIYYLPDDSFLILADPKLVTAAALRGQESGGNQSTGALYWMPASAAMPPQPLLADAIGEIAIDYRTQPDGGARIAWGDFSGNPQMTIGSIVHDGARAALTDRRLAYTFPPAEPDSLVTIAETYDFMDEGKTVLFFTIEKGGLTEGMYMIALDSGKMTKLQGDGAHIETHVFPDERFGLEESNRASDPSSAFRNITGHTVKAVESMLRRAGRADAKEMAERYGGRGFDLFVHDRIGDRRRRLTSVSDLGGEAHQSSPARDGRRIVFAMTAPRSGPFARKGGIYIGTFGTR